MAATPSVTQWISLCCGSSCCQSDIFKNWHSQSYLQPGLLGQTSVWFHWVSTNIWLAPTKLFGPHDAHWHYAGGRTPGSRLHSGGGGEQASWLPPKEFGTMLKFATLCYPTNTGQSKSYFLSFHRSKMSVMWWEGEVILDLCWAFHQLSTGACKMLLITFKTD